jgi:hypothetical protein
MAVALTQLEVRVGNVKSIAEHPTLEKLPTVACTGTPGCVYFLDVAGAEPDPPKETVLAYRGLQEQALNDGARRIIAGRPTRAASVEGNARATGEALTSADQRVGRLTASTPIAMCAVLIA